MPSPFPGMDPYLEDPSHWPGVHLTLIGVIRTALNRVIRPKYLAIVEERVYVSDEPEDLPLVRAGRVSDVMVRQQNDEVPVGSGATVLIDKPTVARTMFRIQRRERNVVVIEAGSRAVVTVIELLSPANKRTGSRGRANYLRKRREIFRSAAGLVEIDLLRDGAGFFRRPTGLSTDYGVHVSPPAMRPNGNIWTVPLLSRLPVIGVPLSSADPDAPLDLQTVFNTAYDDGSFDGLADYTRPPNPPLPSELDAWADNLLKQKGLR